MTKFFVSDQFSPPTLMRRTETGDACTDEVFAGGSWQPTKAIVDYMAGHNDFVDPVSEPAARVQFPAAFDPDPVPLR